MMLQKVTEAENALGVQQDQNYISDDPKERTKFVVLSTASPLI